MNAPVGLPSSLLVITDRHRAAEPLTTVLADATRGGARWIRVREPDLGLFEYISLCHALIDAVASARVVWSVRPPAYALLRTAHPDLRLAVHLTARDAPFAAPESVALVGRSVHRDTLAGERVTDASDYLLLAPVFATSSKPGVSPLGTPGLRDYAQGALVPGDSVMGDSVPDDPAPLRVPPIVALGGITVERVAQCRDAGAMGVAVCGGVMESESPADSVRAYLEAWGG